MPRFVYNDMPLGNPLGKPGNREMQRKTVEMALALSESATAPGTVMETGFTWHDDELWKDNYARVDDANREALLRLGEENRRRRARNKKLGLTR